MVTYNGEDPCDHHNHDPIVQLTVRTVKLILNSGQGEPCPVVGECLSILDEANAMYDARPKAVPPYEQI